MKKNIFKSLILSVVMIITSCSITITDPKSENPLVEEKIVVMGDSWAFFAEEFYGTFSKSLIKFDLDKQLQIVNFNVSGLRADQILSQNGIITTTAYFKTVSNVKYVVLSIGGNDTLNYWNTYLTEEDQIKELTKIGLNVIGVIKLVKTLVPEAKIIVYGLTYPSVDLSKVDANLLGETTINHWIAMGKPTPFQINSALVYWSKIVSEYARSEYMVYYCNNFGIMQWNEDNTLPKPGNYPDYKPFIGGDITKIGPSEKMKHFEGLVDSIHLNAEGYQILTDRLFERFIKSDFK